MAASAVFILDLAGKAIISRDYRGEVDIESCSERFAVHVAEHEHESLSYELPIWQDNGITYVHIKTTGGLFVMAATTRNVNASLTLKFLHCLVNVMNDYFGVLSEESLRDNFVVTYELLDEMMDNGYPQIADPKTLKQVITGSAHKQLVKQPTALGEMVTGAVPWRAPGIKHRKNEVFLDVVETVNILAAANGTLLRSEVAGSLQMRSYLSGMPELKLGLNDELIMDLAQKKAKAVEMEDVKFHQCVRLARFENDRTISFIPPDGEFELMSYRLNTQVKPLLWVEAVVESHYHSRVEYMIKAKSQYKQRVAATNVEIIIPVSPDACTPTFKTSVGKVAYAPERNAIVWSIDKFSGGKEYLMRAHVGLPSMSNDDEKPDKPPITIRFEIPYFTVTGMQVRYLKVIEKSGYQALPWVRYITKNGSYELRT